MNIKILCSLLSLSLLSWQAVAQASEGGMLYVSGGSSWLNPTALNTLTSSQAYSPLESLTWGHGFGAYAIYQKFLFGGEYNSLWGQISKGGQDTSRLTGDYALFHIGYAVLGTANFQLYPYLGLGSGSMQLRSTQPFNQLLNMSQGSNQSIKDIRGQSWLLDLGLGTNLTIPMSPSNSTDPRGFSVGLRTGYLFSLGGTQWHSNELPVTGGPDMNPGGFYLRLLLGFGTYQP